MLGIILCRCSFVGDVPRSAHVMHLHRLVGGKARKDGYWFGLARVGRRPREQRFRLEEALCKMSRTCKLCLGWVVLNSGTCLCWKLMMSFTRFVHVCIATVINFYINHFHESLLKIVSRNERVTCWNWIVCMLFCKLASVCLWDVHAPLETVYLTDLGSEVACVAKLI